MANACLDLGLRAADHDRDYGFDKRYDVDLRALQDLSRFGPGLVVDINDEQSRILVWLR
jgi:hypothetical protein